MRIALAAYLATCAACGDNEPECGHVEVLRANRNIWGGHIAVDGERVYYSDYDNGIGTHLVFRQPREGGQPLVIAAHGETNRFGYGMTTDATHVYWSAENALTGYYLLATPLLGGTTLQLGPISECTAHGVAVDDVNAYAGSVNCNGIPAKVTAVPHDGSPQYEVWSSVNADVSSIAAVNGDVLIATTEGLVRVSAAGTQLLDGQPSYQVVVAGDEIVYSTYEKLAAIPIAGGAPRTIYTYSTPVLQPRPFAIDGGDLYIVEPPQLLLLPPGGEPTPIVHDMGSAITHIAARDGAAYWATLAAPGSLGLIDTFSGAVFRVVRPCQ